MLRILFIEKDKNTKTNNFKALDIGKNYFKNCEIKNWLMVILLMEVRYLLQNYFKSTIINYRGTS